ncbi:MAG: hypothetical protein AB7E80_14575 [Hyphomicrobiaceae bacterium]
MEVFLAYAAFILIAAAPFLVVLAVLGALRYGLSALVGGVLSARPARAALGAITLLVGVASGVVLINWATTKPPQSEQWTAHALVHAGWRHVYLRVHAMKWMLDGTFGQLEGSHPPIADPPGSTR